MNDTDIIQRLATLEAKIEKIIERDLGDFVTRLEDQAELLSIREGLGQICAATNLDKEVLFKHMAERKKYYHDAFLRRLESDNPFYAASMDHRSAEDISTMTDDEAGFGDNPPQS